MHTLLDATKLVASKKCEQYFPTQCGQWLASEDKNQPSSLLQCKINSQK